MLVFAGVPSIIANTGHSPIIQRTRAARQRPFDRARGW